MPRRREPADSAERGRAAETRARQLLEARGLTTLARNFRGRWGELDLVMRQGQLIVFVEVRSRLNNSHGGAVGSVTRAKQQRLLRTAMQFLQQYRLAHCPARFDIVAFDGAGTQGRMQWLQDAFRADD